MRALGTVVLVVLLSACTSTERQSEPEAPPPAASAAETPADQLPTRAERLWSAPLRALSQPVAAGDSLVGVVQARGDELDIVSLDRETGYEQWRAPFQATGESVGVWFGDLVYRSASGEELVVYQRARTGSALTDRAAPYVAVDPDTGDVVAETRPLRTAFGAVTCDDGRDVCLRVGEETFDETRWVLGRWTLRPERELPAGASQLGSDGPVYSVRGTVDGYSAAVAVRRTGPNGWSRPAKAYLPGKGWRLADGEGWYDEASDVAVIPATAVVTQDQLNRYESGERVALDQSRRRTVGIDATTGRLLWQHDGADFRCMELARSGVPVRCAVTGHVVHRQGWAEPRPRGLAVSVEGFDPRTGDTTWSYELPARVAERVVLDHDELDATVDRIIDGDTAMVLPGREGWSVVSLADGEARAVPARESVLCLTTLPFTYALDVPGGRSVFGEERERRVAEPCGVDGKDSRRPLGAAGLLAAGVDAGDGIRAVALTDRLVGYRLS